MIYGDTFYILYVVNWKSSCLQAVLLCVDFFGALCWLTFLVASSFSPARKRLKTLPSLTCSGKMGPCLGNLWRQRPAKPVGPLVFLFKTNFDQVLLFAGEGQSVTPLTCSSWPVHLALYWFLKILSIVFFLFFTSVPWPKWFKLMFYGKVLPVYLIILQRLRHCSWDLVLRTCSPGIWITQAKFSVNSRRNRSKLN